MVHGQAVCRTALRGNQVGYGLGLRQVHLAIQKGALCKFAGSSHAATLRQQQLQNRLLNVERPVTGNFDHVFARKRMWRAEFCYQHLVNRVVAIAYLPETHRVGRHCCYGYTIGSRAENAVAHAEGIVSRNTNNGNATDARRRRNGTNGLVVAHT